MLLSEVIEISMLNVRKAQEAQLSALHAEKTSWMAEDKTINHIKGWATR